MTKAGSTELERPSVTVSANVANEEVSADLNSLTPINSRNKFSSTNAKSSVAYVVNPDKTERDGNKSTDSKLADKDPADEATSSDLEETCADSQAYLMLLNMSSGIDDDSFSSEETANTNQMLEIKHTPNS